MTWDGVERREHRRPGRVEDRHVGWHISKTVNLSAAGAAVAIVFWMGFSYFQIQDNTNKWQRSIETDEKIVRLIEKQDTKIITIIAEHSDEPCHDGACQKLAVLNEQNRHFRELLTKLERVLRVIIEYPGRKWPLLPKDAGAD